MKYKNVLSILMALIMVTIFIGCGAGQNQSDELMTEPSYDSESGSTDDLGDGVQLIDGYEVMLMPGAAVSYYVSKPHVSNRIKGVNYVGDGWWDDYVTMNRYKEFNCPRGTAYMEKLSGGELMWEYSTQLKYGLNSDDSYRKVEYCPLKEEMLAYSIVGKDTVGSSQKGEKVKNICDVQCVSVAMYEDFYEDRPTFTIKVYGIPDSLWESKLGSLTQYSWDDYWVFRKALSSNNYTECELLDQQVMEKSGVYYIDYNALEKRGNYVNYLIVGEFSKSCEYAYCVYGKDRYEITQEAEYQQWKTDNIDKFIAGE